MKSFRLLFVLLALGLVASSTAFAQYATLGVRGWYAGGDYKSETSNGFETFNSDDELYPQVYFSYSFSNSFWISTAYGEADVTLTPAEVDGALITGSFSDVDSDLMFGKTLFGFLDVGVGWRYAEVTRTFSADGNTFTDIPRVSSGPMIFLGGGDLVGQSSFGYYWAAAYMFYDTDDDGVGNNPNETGDGKEEHYNVEVGFRWDTGGAFSTLIGYRLKSYQAEVLGDLEYSGPTLNFAYTF